MAEVDVLVQGFVNRDITRVQATTSLVRDDQYVIIVDPGTAGTDAITAALAEHELSPNDVTHVCLTHSHLDHFRSIGIFNNADVIDYWGYWHGNEFTYNTKARQLTRNISILPSPGHSSDSISLLVKTSRGVVAVCGDVFWSKKLDAPDPYAEDQAVLKESRNMILSQAHWIIPGHGPMFEIDTKVNR